MNMAAEATDGRVKDLFVIGWRVGCARRPDGGGQGPLRHWLARGVRKAGHADGLAPGAEILHVDELHAVEPD